jgi:uncharacterized membrane protein
VFSECAKSNAFAVCTTLQLSLREVMNERGEWWFFVFVNGGSGAIGSAVSSHFWSCQGGIDICTHILY